MLLKQNQNNNNAFTSASLQDKTCDRLPVSYGSVMQIKPQQVQPQAGSSKLATAPLSTCHRLD